MRKRFRRIFLTSFFIILASLIASFSLFLYVLTTLPSSELIQERKIAESTKIFDRTGAVLLYEIHGEEKRTVIPFAEIPESVKHATIAVEDINFYNHSALDWKSIARALLANIAKRRIVQGGSTITQQLAKNVFLTPERTLVRKLRELALAFQLEKRFTKDQILEIYLNQIPYGSNAYGIESASLTFFGKNASDLTLGEAATLASLPKAPTYYSPWGSNVKALLARRDYTLEQMEHAGFITEKELRLAKAESPKFQKPYLGIKAPHFVTMVQDYLNKQYGEEFVRTAGLKVITTLDWPMQQTAEKVVTEGVERNTKLYQGTNAALVVEDPKTGQILALVGSKDYFDTDHDGNFNVASQGLRQPGSSIKPIIYAAAFKKGLTPDTVLFDLETEFDTTGDPEKSYKPVNYDGLFRGPITIRKALANSVNIPAVKTLYLVGLDEALRTARSFGLTTLTEKSRYGLSLVLGGGEVKLVDMVNAYSAFANDGASHKQSIILSVSTKNKALEEYQYSEERAIETQYARLINDILSDAEARRPLFGSSLDLPSLSDYQIAVKTGTTNDFRDAWSIGYTPNIVVGVWAGNNDNTPMTKHGSSIFAAAPMWKNFMNEIVPGTKATAFIKPDQLFPEKPVLRGEYIVRYRNGDVILPQIHSVLFYLDKKNPGGQEAINPEDDPQFLNWEKPVLEWAEKNVVDFKNFNQPLPPGSTALAPGLISIEQRAPEITVIKPANGEFINGFIEMDFHLTSGFDLVGFRVLIDDIVVDLQSGSLGKDLFYRKNFIVTDQNLQHKVVIETTDSQGNKSEKTLLVFKSLN